MKISIVTASVIFFFKQKTAYEIRKGDWSSDVCSSDLLPGQGPVRVGIPVADLTAGIFLAQGILGALIERERSGKGQWVHTSLLEAMVTMLDFQAARWLIDSEIAPQAGNDHPTGIPTGVFK